MSYTEQRTEFDDPSTSFGPGGVRLPDRGPAGRVTLLKESHVRLDVVQQIVVDESVGLRAELVLEGHAVERALVPKIRARSGRGVAEDLDDEQVLQQPEAARHGRSRPRSRRRRKTWR